MWFQGPVANNFSLIQLMDWCQAGNKPLPETVMTQFNDEMFNEAFKWVHCVVIMSCIPYLFSLTFTQEIHWKFWGPISVLFISDGVPFCISSTLAMLLKVKQNCSTSDHDEKNSLCTRNTVWCCYSAINFLQILTTDAPYLAHEGKVWGVFYEFEIWFVFCCWHCIVINDIMIYCSAL